MVWHAGLLVKLHRLDMPIGLLKMIAAWLENQQAYIVFGEKKSSRFNTNIGLLQGSSLSPYLFVVYHSDLTKCLGAHWGHLYADDLSVLISAPVMKSLIPMLKYMQKEGTNVCSRIAQYARK